MNRRVVITGIGISTAHGTGKDINWERTQAGVSGIKNITSFDASGYMAGQGGEIKGFKKTFFNNLRDKRLDRATHLLVHTAREALLESGIVDIIKDKPALLSLGTTLGGMLSGELFHRETIAKGLNRARLSLLNDYLAYNQAVNLMREFNFAGDFMIFSNACASGSNAIGHALNSIRSGCCDIAVCGGYDTMCEFTFAGFNSLMALSPSLCRPFDRNRDGLALGEGAGILVLEEAGHAIGRGAKILGEAAGYGEASDAYHMTAPEPSGRSAALAITRAWNDAGKPVIDYINAHGTGTKYNDTMETNAIVSALGERAGDIPVSSTKSMVGHILGGAGAVEAVISLLAIRHKTVPPTLNYENPDPGCGLNIVKQAVGHNIKTVLSNSFGFGGSNAAVILKEYV
ncbi:MAG: beta-ketoacyl-[acyl-carrier-protein] synthase family protein [Nitrospiraceae bacterium]|nr:MAG: beta-ketoacyl-[acyl-carrier-protein] synthase family protein [Nitrospiraceae bacterium]